MDSQKELERTMRLAAARRAAVVRLRQTGMTMEKIAQKYGVSRQRVFQLLKKAEHLGEYSPSHPSIRGRY